MEADVNGYHGEGTRGNSNSRIIILSPINQNFQQNLTSKPSYQLTEGLIRVFDNTPGQSLGQLKRKLWFSPLNKLQPFSNIVNPTLLADQ